MPRVAPPPKPARKPAGPPPRRPRGTPTLGNPRDMKDRPRGWQLALRRQRRRIKPVLYAAAVLGLVFAGLSLVHASSHAASLTSLRARFGALGAGLGLRVQTVLVRGRQETPQPLVDAAIGVSPGDPLLAFSVAQARSRLLSIASVRDATVERRWPSTVVVTLDERHAYAVWQTGGRFVLIDRAGASLADQDVRLARGLPLVVGPGAPEHAAALLDDMDHHPGVQSHLVAAVRVGDRRWNLRITSGADVLLPEQGQTAALDRLEALQASHQLLDRRLRVIDLRLPDRTTLRAQPGPAAPPSPAAPSSTAAPPRQSRL